MLTRTSTHNQLAMASASTAVAAPCKSPRTFPEIPKTFCHPSLVVPTYVKRWAEARVDSAPPIPEKEFMLSFKPSHVDETVFWTQLLQPAVLSFVFMLREFDDLTDQVTLFDAINQILSRPMPSFEFKLWALYWVYTAGSEEDQISMYDILEQISSLGFIKFVPEEIQRADELIRTIVKSTSHLCIEHLTHTPIYEPSSESTGYSAEMWFDVLCRYAVTGR